MASRTQQNFFSILSFNIFSTFSRPQKVEKYIPTYRAKYHFYIKLHEHVKKRKKKIKKP